jgi:hypothetical protein
MYDSKTALQAILCFGLCASGINTALAEYEPNDNYSTFVVSYQTAKFTKPVCISGGECHDLIAGPAVYYAKQAIPNLVLGMSGSQLQASGKLSSIKSSTVSAFLEYIAGLASIADVGTSVAALSATTELCTSLPNTCASVNDNGTNVGVFGKVFLADKRTLSLTLSYNSIYYQQSPNQSVIGLTLFAILAKKHRVAFTVDRVRDASGNDISGGLGLSYSYLLNY